MNSIRAVMSDVSRLLSAKSALILSLLAAPAAGVYAADPEPDPDALTPVLRKVERVNPLRDEKAAGTQQGALITLEANERPLKTILDYLSTVSGKNIRVVKEKDNKLPVTFKLENVTYQAILDFIARKYGMSVDTSKVRENIILLDTPEKVSMVFQQADIQDVINTIAIQSSANIVVGPEVTGKVTMRLENVPWNDALNIVVRTLDFVAVPEANNTIRITSPSKIAQQLDIRIFRLAYISPEGSKYTAVLTSEFAKREESKDTQAAGLSLIDVLTKVKSAQGSISFEKRSNALVVRDTSTILDQMQTIIDKLDVPPKQVHVAVKLVELTDQDAENIGVNWSNGLRFQVTPVSSWTSAFPFDVSGGLSRSLLGDLSVASANRTEINRTTGQAVAVSDIFSLRQAVGRGADVLGGATPGIGLGSMGFVNTTALFELVRNKSTGRVIQAPQLIAIDNEEATIQVGQLVRYAETFVANTEGGGNVSGFREAAGSPLKLGLQLLIIPHVTGPENNVLMTIIPKVESFAPGVQTNGAPAGFQRFLGAGVQLDLPQTQQRIVVTKMMLRNGETGVIGGLRNENENTAESRVPVFGDIPILGRLFKHRSRNSNGLNLLIFVTPTIIDFHEGGDGQFKKELQRVRDEIAAPVTGYGDDELR